MMEAIRILHIPNTTPIEVKEPEPPPGYMRMRYEPNIMQSETGREIFKRLLSLSTQLFEKVSKKGEI